MKIGMTLPVMEPDLDRKVLRDWTVTIDQGPWASLAFGERIIFDNPDAAVMLGAAAAWTERVEIVTTIFVAQLHNPTMLAKQIATTDMLCDGRLTVGLGIGGREEDYLAAGADYATHKNADLQGRVEAMRRVWAGETVVEMADRRVGPPPVQKGGPRMLAAAMGPKAIALASQWADGVCGMDFGPDPEAIGTYFDMVRKAWADVGKTTPHLGTSFWFAIGDEARAQVETHLKRYFTWVDEASRDAIAASAGFAGSLQDLRDVLKRIEDKGTDEVQLIPTSSNLDQVKRIADIIG
ncbi:MAG: LLM class flavin-dependent oxidoreductase [Novosphingobium sp.]|nr:LLM class flavin-dependent oxidoreductase [Novosphingobium sp.]